MRAVVQRVQRVSVTVAGETVGQIQAGCLVLLGVGLRDEDADACYLAEKVAHLRIFPDEAGRMNRSLLDCQGSALVVSQFTLYGDCRQGRRPGFSRAAPPEVARRLFEVFCQELATRGVTVEKDRFQALMQVELVNDGPVTLLLDSKREF